MPVEELDLHPEWTLESLVVDDHNHLVYAGAREVIRYPGTKYNPFYIYGGTEEERTQFLYSIRHRARDNGHVTLYITAEDFKDRVARAISDDEPDQFQDRYAPVEFLLFDGVEKLGKTEEARERFFHWFDSILLARKQIVIASAFHPRDMPLLDDRLRSRFVWGLITEITPPDLAIQRPVAPHSRVQTARTALRLAQRGR